MKTFLYMTIGLIVVLLATPEQSTTAQNSINFGRQSAQEPVPDPAPNQIVVPADEVVLSRASVEALCETFTGMLATQSYYQFTVRIDAAEISITPHSEAVKVQR